MMASSPELSLDCKPYSHSMLLKSFDPGEHINTNSDSDHSKKLEEFLSHLEEERLKIDAFKRELPLCIQLLTNAMEASRQQLQSYRAGAQKPVLEEFIPPKNTASEGTEKSLNMSDKTNWMTSLQLWTTQANEDITKQQSSPKELSCDTKLGLDDRQRNGGAFHPFSKDGSSCPSPSLTSFSDLALSNSSHKEMEEHKKNSEASYNCRRENSGKFSDSSAEKGQVKDSQSAGNNHSNTTQTNRKARRCWSPDLHRRFVNALQMLGGSQVATPKQIRELMKVDGLTNDEVKSHLQKFRLHTRRPSSSPQAAAPGGPQVVVLGGIWVPQEYAAAAAAHGGGAPAALYGAHHSTHVSAPYCSAPPVPQEFYSALAPPPSLPSQATNHPMHHQLHAYKPPISQAQTHSSPGSDVPGGTGDRSESMEDGKSESSSWKPDSVVENGERKRLVLKEEGEESNGSEITLKF